MTEIKNVPGLLKRTDENAVFEVSGNHILNCLFTE